MVEQVEDAPAVLDRLGLHLAAAAVVALGLRKLFEGGPLGRHDLVESLGDLIVDTPQVVLFESFLPALPEFAEHLPDPLQPGAVHLHALVEHPAQGGVRVTMFDQFISHGPEQGVRV